MDVASYPRSQNNSIACSRALARSNSGGRPRRVAWLTPAFYSDH
jgi:hypothetical protein